MSDLYRIEWDEISKGPVPRPVWQLVKDGVLVPDTRLQAIADTAVTMRYCSEDGFLSQADAVHPCEYLAESDGEDCDCEIVDVQVVIGLDALEADDGDIRVYCTEQERVVDPYDNHHCREGVHMELEGTDDE